MGNFKEDQKRRDLLIYAFYERKQYRDDWIGRIGAELAEQRQSPDPEKSIEKMEIALEAWRSLHPVIERYPDAASEWDKLHFPELWEIVTKDRDLSNVIYNGILLLKSKIIERRDSAGLPALHKDMKNLAYGKDSKDYQKWELLNELEDGLHDAFRQDQPKTPAPTGEQEINPEIKKLVNGHKKYSDWDDRVFEAIDSIKETTQEKRVEQFCKIYDAPPAIISSYKTYSTRDVNDGERRERRKRVKKV